MSDEPSELWKYFVSLREAGEHKVRDFSTQIGAARYERFVCLRGFWPRSGVLA